MRTLISLYNLTPEQEQKISSVAPEWKIIFSSRDDKIKEHLFNEAEIIFGWSSLIESISLKQSSNLKWLQVWSAGIDWLPLEKLQTKQVILTSGSGVHPVQVTETVFSMLLAFNRNLHQAIRNQSKQVWDRSGSFTELKGKTMGILGVGTIGVETARIAKAFGMNTIGLRRSEKGQPHIDQMININNINHLLHNSDVVVNILPNTPETKLLIDESKFRVMKKGAIFINVGRGETVDTAALIEALDNGQISAVGLDVVHPEPLPEDNPLWKMENVIISPHIGGETHAYKDRITDIFVENLKTYIKTDKPGRNIVDYKTLY